MSAPAMREVGVGTLGYGFMGKAHANAFGLFDNGGSNSLHAEPTIAAAESGRREDVVYR
jgi:hypothetical protein